MVCVAVRVVCLLEGLSVMCECRLRREARGLASPRYTYCKLLCSISVPYSTPDAASCLRRDTARQPVRRSHTAVQCAPGRLAPQIHPVAQIEPTTRSPNEPRIVTSGRTVAFTLYRGLRRSLICGNLPWGLNFRTGSRRCRCPDQAVGS